MHDLVSICRAKSLRSHQMASQSTHIFWGGGGGGLTRPPRTCRCARDQYAHGHECHVLGRARALLTLLCVGLPLPKSSLVPSLADHTHFQGEWVWVLWTAFRASLRNVRGSNLIGPFLTRHMTSCMLAVYIVLLSFLRTQRKVMMAARSRLSDFLRLFLAALSFLSLPVYQSNCSKQLLSILVEEKLIQHRESISLNVCVKNSLCSCLP